MLLKPFYSARLLDTNDDIDSDNGILVLQAADDKEEENEDEMRMEWMMMKTRRKKKIHLLS